MLKFKKKKIRRQKVKIHFIFSAFTSRPISLEVNNKAYEIRYEVLSYIRVYLHIPCETLFQGMGIFCVLYRIGSKNNKSFKWIIFTRLSGIHIESRENSSFE